MDLVQYQNCPYGAKVRHLRPDTPLKQVAADAHMLQELGSATVMLDGSLNESAKRCRGLEKSYGV